MKNDKYYLVMKAKYDEGTTIFIKTEGFDYGIDRKENGSVAIWEGDIDNYVSQELQLSAVKASVDDIMWWHDTLLKMDRQPELLTILGNMRYQLQNNSDRKMYLFNCKTKETISCWKKWRCGDIEAERKLRDVIVECCKDGFTNDNLKRLYSKLDDVDYLNGAPYCKWYLRWISKDGDVALIKSVEDNKPNELVLYITENGRQPQTLSCVLADKTLRMAL